MADIIYLTKEWFKKLQEELVYLKGIKRIEIAKKLKEAISFWDLSENSEYEDARNEQAQVELRISNVEEQLKHVELINEKVSNSSKVTMWSIVVIENIEDKEVQEYKIVWATESNILSKPSMISNESSVWKNLLWKKKWEIIKIKVSSGLFEYKILEIK